MAERYGVKLVRGIEGEGFCCDPSRIYYGSNSGFQAINLAIHMLRKGRIVLVGFGAGLTWGAALLEWEPQPTARSQFSEMLREGWYIFAHIRSMFLRFFRLVEALLWHPPASRKDNHRSRGRDNGSGPPDNIL